MITSEKNVFLSNKRCKISNSMNQFNDTISSKLYKPVKRLITNWSVILQLAGADYSVSNFKDH
jgi:hypothetical protein